MSTTVFSTTVQEFVWIRDGVEAGQALNCQYYAGFIDGAWILEGLKPGAAWIVKDAAGVNVHEGKCGFVALFKRSIGRVMKLFLGVFTTIFSKSRFTQAPGSWSVISCEGL